MKKHRKTATIVGVLILMAYSILGSNNADAKFLSMFLEIISGLAVISIAVLMFPLLKPYGKKTSQWYLTVKGIEGMLMITAGVLFVLQKPILLALRDQIYQVHGYIFAISALMFYYLLYRSKFIPRWLSIWGVIAANILIMVNILELLDVIPLQIDVLYLPIVLNEVVLAFWLIMRGFSAEAE